MAHRSHQGGIHVNLRTPLQGASVPVAGTVMVPRTPEALAAHRLAAARLDAHNGVLSNTREWELELLGGPRHRAVEEQVSTAFGAKAR